MYLKYIIRGGGVMKNRKGKKVFFIIAGSLVGIGLLMAVIGLAMGATKKTIFSAARTYGIYESGDKQEIDKKEHNDLSLVKESYQEVKKLDLDIDLGEVVIIHKEDIEGIKIVNKSEKRNVSIDYNEEDAKLTVKSEDGSWLHWKHQYDAHIIIYVPTDYEFEEVDLDLAAGRIEADRIQATKLDIDIDAGELIIESFKAQEIEASTGAGRIKATGDVKEKIEIESGVGEVSLTLLGQESDFNYNLEVGIGEILIGDHTYSGIKDKHIESALAKKSAEVNCGVGSVKLNFK